MPRKPREIRCPECREPKLTAAAPRMVVRCGACGERFRVPDRPGGPDVPDGLYGDEDDTDTAGSTAVPAAVDPSGGAPDESGDPTGPGVGVTIVAATPRVGAPAPVPVHDDQADDDGAGEPAAAVEPAAVDGEDPEARRVRRAREAGRRGGMAAASYRRARRRE